MSDEKEQHAGLALLPPPLIYLAFLATGLVVNLYYQIPLSSSGTSVTLMLGLVIVSVGLAVGALAFNEMRKAGVSPLPWRAPGKLVVDGPFRFSRNPIYVSLTIMYVGISVAVNTAWPLVFLVFAIVIVDRETIPQEEKFLEKKFGEEYRSYRKRARRWV